MEYWWNGSCQGIPEALSEKPVPVPLCPPQTSHGLSWERTWVSAVRTCFTAGPLVHQSLHTKTYTKYETNPTYILAAAFLPGWNNGYIAARGDHIVFCQVGIWYVKIRFKPFNNQNRYN
jgi:hypothetical protein